VDVALVVAYDALTEPENLIDHAARRVGATASMDVAAPYDARADGVVVGEAAAAIVLERCGGVATLQAADGCGEDGMAVLERLIAPWSGGAVLVDGCAAAKPEVDIREREMLARRLGTDALLTATGAAMGELGAAKPLVQVIALVEMLQRGVAAPVAGLRQVPGGGVSPLVRETRHGCRVGLALSWGAPGVGGVLGVERE
jgi:3-oxoacyl-(acyl-carrier-protein) synthase